MKSKAQERAWRELVGIRVAIKELEESIQTKKANLEARYSRLLGAYLEDHAKFRQEQEVHYKGQSNNSGEYLTFKGTVEAITHANSDGEIVYKISVPGTNDMGYVEEGKLR